jgi:hypothetical protein
LAKQKAEREEREKGEQKNVSEAQREVDYDDDYQDMVRRVGEKAKAADALKAQGKEPQTKFNPKTGRYYVDHGQGTEVDEAGYGRNRGYTPGIPSPHAPTLGGRGRREDDEGWDRETPVPVWYILADGKLIKDKMGVPYHYRDKEVARKAAMTMMSKSFNAGKKFVLTTKPEDNPPENEAVLHTNYKRNRFKAIDQRDQAQNKASNMAMNRVNDEVDEGMSGQVVFSGTGANGGKYEIIQSGPTDYMIHANGRHIDTYGSLQRAMSVLKNEVLGLTKGVAEGMKSQDLAMYCEKLVAEKGWDAAYKHALMMANVGRDPAWNGVLKYLDAMKEGVAEGSLEEDKGMKQYWAFKREWRAKHGANAKVPGYDSREYTAWQWRQADKQQGVAEERTETKNEKGEVTSWRDESDWRKVGKEKDGRGRVTNLSDKARRETEKLKKEKSVDEGWKSALGGAALAGAMALGGGAAHAQSGEDFLPEIVAHVTFKVDGNTITKDINLGNSFKSPGQASAALEKFLKSKGIKFYEFSIERVKPKNPDYLEKTPASDTGASGSMDSGPYSASGSSDNYMAKESIDEAVARAVKSMSEDGYEFIEAANPAQQAAIAISMKKAGKKPKTEEKVRLDSKCWTGKKIGNPKTKLKGGVRVNNCVPK